MGNIGSDPGPWGKGRIQGPFSKDPIWYGYKIQCWISILEWIFSTGPYFTRVHWRIQSPLSSWTMKNPESSIKLYNEDSRVLYQVVQWRLQSPLSSCTMKNPESSIKLYNEESRVFYQVVQWRLQNPLSSCTIQNSVSSRGCTIKNPGSRGGDKDFVGRGKNFFYPPLEKYHDVYQIIGFNWVWFAFSTHFWDLQTESNKGFITYLSAFPLFYTLHYSHSFYINYKDL